MAFEIKANFTAGRLCKVSETSNAHHESRMKLERASEDAARAVGLGHSFDHSDAQRIYEDCAYPLARIHIAGARKVCAIKRFYSRIFSLRENEGGNHSCKNYNTTKC